MNNYLDQIFYKSIKQVADELTREMKNEMKDYYTYNIERDESDNIIVKFNLAGVRKKDIKLYITGDIFNINIDGESEYNKEFKISKDYDTNSITSKYENGLLTVNIPKKIKKRKDILIN